MKKLGFFNPMKGLPRLFETEAYCVLTASGRRPTKAYCLTTASVIREPRHIASVKKIQIMGQHSGQNFYLSLLPRLKENRGMLLQ